MTVGMVGIAGTIDAELARAIDDLVSSGKYPTKSSAVRGIIGAYFENGMSSEREQELNDEVESLKAQLEALRKAPTERVVVLLDVQNVCHELRRLGVFIDYRMLRDNAVRGRHMVSATAFDGRHYSAEKDTTRAFHDILIQNGWALDLRDLHDETHQKEVDVSLATSLISGAVGDTYDTAVIISGDRDFVPAIEYVRSMGRRVEVMSFESSLSSQLAKVADSVTLLDTSFIVRLSTDSEGVEA